MFTIKMYNHKAHTINNGAEFETSGEAWKKTFDQANIHLSLYKHHGTPARITKTSFGYKVRDIEIKIVEI